MALKKILKVKQKTYLVEKIKIYTQGTTTQIGWGTLAVDSQSRVMVGVFWDFAGNVLSNEPLYDIERTGEVWLEVVPMTNRVM